MSGAPIDPARDIYTLADLIETKDAERAGATRAPLPPLPRGTQAVRFPPPGEPRFRPAMAALAEFHDRAFDASVAYQRSVGDALEAGPLRVSLSPQWRSVGAYSCDGDRRQLIMINPDRAPDADRLRAELVLQMQHASYVDTFSALHARARRREFETPKRPRLQLLRRECARGLSRADQLLARHPQDHAAVAYARARERIERIASRQVHDIAREMTEKGLPGAAIDVNGPLWENGFNSQHERYFASQVLSGHAQLYLDQYDLLSGKTNEALGRTPNAVRGAYAMSFETGADQARAAARLVALYADPASSATLLAACLRTGVRQHLLAARGDDLAEFLTNRGGAALSGAERHAIGVARAQISPRNAPLLEAILGAAYDGCALDGPPPG